MDTSESVVRCVCVCVLWLVVLMRDLGDEVTIGNLSDSQYLVKHEDWNMTHAIVTVSERRVCVGICGDGQQMCCCVSMLGKYRSKQPSVL